MSGRHGAFALAMLPVVFSPGASFTLVTHRVVNGQRRAAALVVAGTALGIVSHAVLAGTGLAAVMRASPGAYRSVCLVGAALLIILGAAMVRRSWRVRAPDVPRPVAAEPRDRTSIRAASCGALASSYVTALLNPKAAGVYLTIAPQFAPRGDAFATTLLQLAAVHVALTTIWLAGWSTALQRAVPRTEVRSWLPWVERLGGLVLAVIGLRSLSAVW